MVTSDSIAPGAVGLKVIENGRLRLGLRVNGPVGEIENSPPTSGIEPDKTPLPLLRSDTCLVAEPLTLVGAKVTVAGADRTPA